MSKQKSQYLTSAEQYLKKKGISFKAPERIYICYSQKVTKSFIKESGFKLISDWKRGELYKKGKKGILVNLGLGGAPLNLAMEELHALGAKEFCILGFAGGINPELEPGDIIDSKDWNIYSTDDPYKKETKAWLNYMKRCYIDAVDMETASLENKGYQLGIKTKSYLIIKDLLSRDGWDLNYDLKKIQDTYLALLKMKIKQKHL